MDITPASSPVLSLTRLQADLHWAIASPPLLALPVADVPAFSAGDYLALWSAAPLQLASQHLHTLPAFRLGMYFEKLWQLFLLHHPAYQLLLANLPVRDAERTLGEFDLLLRDTIRDRVCHWELALKFYLGIDDLDDPGNWHGPGLHDRLQEKLQHLAGHQLRLSQTTAGAAALRAQGLQVDDVRALIKGRLFYPLAVFLSGRRAAFAAPDHLRGFWATAAELRDWLTNGDTRASLLMRSDWLAPVENSGEVPSAEFLLPVADANGNEADGKPQHPQALVVTRHGKEIARGFCVPDDWQLRARHARRSVQSMSPAAADVR